MVINEISYHNTNIHGYKIKIDLGIALIAGKINHAGLLSLNITVVFMYLFIRRSFSTALQYPYTSCAKESMI